MSESDVPRGFFMVGGVPTKSQDLAPCIIFTLAYICIIPLAFRRLVNKESRSSQLYGPAVFIPIRIASFILRAVQTGGNGSLAMIIVTQIFYSAGFPIICDPVVTLLEYHITRTHTSPTQGLWTQRAIRALRLTLLASLIIAIIAGTKINGADTPEELAELRKLNIINSGLCLGIVLGVAFVAIIAQFHKNLPSRATAVLVFTSGCLVVAGAYRLSTIHDRESYRPFSARTKVTFYVLLALVEWLATIALFSVNVRELYAEDLAKEKQRAAKEAEQGSDQV